MATNLRGLLLFLLAACSASKDEAPVSAAREQPSKQHVEPSIDAPVPKATIVLPGNGLVSMDILGRTRKEVDARLGKSGELDASNVLRGRAYVIEEGGIEAPVLVEFENDTAVVIRIYPKGFTNTDPNIDAVLAWAGVDRSADWWPAPDGDGVFVWDRAARERIEPKLRAFEKLRADVVESLRTLFAQTDVDASVRVDGFDLILVAPPGECDRATLRNLRKSFAAFELDPAEGFRNMRCEGGAALKLR